MGETDKQSTGPDVDNGSLENDFARTKRTIIAYTERGGGRERREKEREERKRKRGEKKKERRERKRVERDN